MDIGVGSFVFSQGIVSAIPLLKNPSHLTEPLLPKATTVLRKCSPALVLGLLRTISVKGTEYPVSDQYLVTRVVVNTSQEHVTEYGVHWNFFITLGLLPILQVLLHPLIVYVPISLLGLVVAICTHFFDFACEPTLMTLCSAPTCPLHWQARPVHRARSASRHRFCE